MNKIKNIFSILLNILIAIAILTVIVFSLNIIYTKITKKEYVNIFGYTFFQVATGSMSGTIEIDDVVIVKILNNEEKEVLEINDIIAFKQDNIIVLHRIIEMKENSVITKGDSNNAQDNPIEKEAIVGKLFFTIQNLSIWKKVATTPKVYISVITTIFLFGIALKIDVAKEEIDEKK